jgi:predicted DsbA family dithiol-disulfide isomerase
VVFKNMVVHPQVVTDAHHAGCAAAKQGKFAEFKNAFWDKAFGPYAASGGKDQASLGADNIMKIAQGIGLDAAKLKADMDGPECKAQIEADMAELAKWHVNSTPTFFINGKTINGALPKEAFKQAIDEKLKVAEASGVSGADYYEKEVVGKGEKQFRSKVESKPH